MVLWADGLVLESALDSHQLVRTLPEADFVREFDPKALPATIFGSICL